MIKILITFQKIKNISSLKSILIKIQKFKDKSTLIYHIMSMAYTVKNKKMDNVMYYGKMVVIMSCINLEILHGLIILL